MTAAGRCSSAEFGTRDLAGFGRAAAGFGSPLAGLWQALAGFGRVWPGSGRVLAGFGHHVINRFIRICYVVWPGFWPGFWPENILATLFAGSRIGQRCLPFVTTGECGGRGRPPLHARHVRSPFSNEIRGTANKSRCAPSRV
jgi:hypothetical protein